MLINKNDCIPLGRLNKILKQYFILSKNQNKPSKCLIISY